MKDMHGVGGRMVEDETPPGLGLQDMPGDRCLRRAITSSQGRTG